MRSTQKAMLGMILALALVACWAGTAQADPLIVGNNAAFGGGPINTYGFATGATVNFFIPTGASDSNNGRGLLVVGNEVFYTELSSGFGATDFIRVAPFNGGAGGSDIRTLPNPRPGTGIQDLVSSGGVLYVLTGYPFSPSLIVFTLDPGTGAVLGSVTLGPGADASADGFTVLPNHRATGVARDLIERTAPGGSEKPTTPPGVSLRRVVAGGKPSEHARSAALAPREQRVSPIAHGQNAWWGVTWSVQQHEREEKMLYLGNPG